ncbi:hypothetical protein A7X67_12765 [Clostridium sp. W14A]|nr:hypothetical protein A7X67_12765 [Clostridium sp. W14A]
MISKTNYPVRGKILRIIKDKRLQKLNKEACEKLRRIMALIGIARLIPCPLPHNTSKSERNLIRKGRSHRQHRRFRYNTQKGLRSAKKQTSGFQLLIGGA